MPFLGPRFFRAHGLGNDYLVFEQTSQDAEGWILDPAAVSEVCRRGWGEGSDGIVILESRTPEDGVFPLRMFNPDGSEFERSGNGLRVLGAFLAHEELVAPGTFQVRTGGEEITLHLHGATPEAVLDLSVELGVARVGLEAVEVVGWEGWPPQGSRGSEASFPLEHPGAGLLQVVPVWVGNPHAVVFVEDPAVDLDGPLLQRVGSFLATHPDFRAGTNVQLARVEGGPSSGSGAATPPRLRVGIWERGVGRTPASGTSASAVAAAAVATGRIPPSAPGTAHRVLMPGGKLQVGVSPGLQVELRGPVQVVGTGALAPGFLARLRRLAEG